MRQYSAVDAWHSKVAWKFMHTISLIFITNKSENHFNWSCNIVIQYCILCYRSKKSINAKFSNIYLYTSIHVTYHVKFSKQGYFYGMGAFLVCFIYYKSIWQFSSLLCHMFCYSRIAINTTNFTNSRFQYILLINAILFIFQNLFILCIIRFE